MPSGGDITAITCSHPDLGSFNFYPKADEDSTYQSGGFKSVDDDGMIDASGDIIDKMNRKRCSFEVLLGWDMTDPNRQELESLSALASSPKLADWTFENINGVVYKMKGKPVGDQAGNGNQSTIALKVQGNGNIQIV